MSLVDEYIAIPGSVAFPVWGMPLPTTHESAVVLIPPPEVWGPIQAIRRVHDRQFRRWMPHVTLLYPFLRREALAAARPEAEAALAAVEPFDLELARSDAFHHRGGTTTVWLAPEPKDELVAVQAALLGRFPECDATARFASGFTPHLSVGQARGEDALAALRRALAAWTPLRFTVRHISIIVREPPPRDVFGTYAEIVLGARATQFLRSP